MQLLVAMMVIVTSIWVLVDSKKLGVKAGSIGGFFDMGPVAWFISCLLLWIIAFPAYLAKRSKYQRLAQGLPLADVGQPGPPPGRQPTQCAACTKYFKGPARFCPHCGAKQEP